MRIDEFIGKVLNSTPKLLQDPPAGYYVMQGGAGWIAYNGRQAIWETNDINDMRRWFHKQGLRMPPVQRIQIAVFK